MILRNNMTNGIPDTKEEFDQIVNPDEYARRIALVKKGIESAKHKSERKKRYLETVQRWRKRKDLQDRFDI